MAGAEHDPFDAALGDAVLMMQSGDLTTGDINALARLHNVSPKRLTNNLSAAIYGTPGAEIRSANTRAGDYYGEKFGPVVGSTVSAIDRGARALGNFAYGMTGIPMAGKAGETLSRAQDEGSPMRAAQGVGEGIMAMMPVGMMGRGAVAARTATMPSSATALAGLSAAGLALPGTISDANAQSRDNMAKAVESDPVVTRLRKEIADTEAKHEQINNPKTYYPSTKSREMAVAPIKEKLDALRAEKKAADVAAEKSYRENAAFRDRYPGVAETILYGSGAVAGGLSAANTIKANLVDRFVLQPSIMRSAGAVERAAYGGVEPKGIWQRLTGAPDKTTRPNEAKHALEQDVLRNKLAHRAETEPSITKNSLIGAGIIQEGRMLPEEIDAAQFPYDHPTRQAANAALSDWQYYASGVVPSLLGGYAASGISTKAGNILTRGDTPELARAASLAVRPFPQPPPKPGPLPPANMPVPPPPGPAAGGPGGMPNPPPPLQPQLLAPLGQGGNVPYGAPQKSVVRPFIESELMAGRPGSLNVSDISKQLTTAGVRIPTNAQALSERLKQAQTLAADLKSAGASDQAISSIVAEWMRRNAPGFPAVALGGGVGAIGAENTGIFDR